MPPSLNYNLYQTHDNPLTFSTSTVMALVTAPGLDILGRRCESYFKQLYVVLNDPSCLFRNDLLPTEVQDELGRFKIWARNIGALQPRTMTSSLEYRLRDASHARQLIAKLLKTLEEVLQERIIVPIGED